MPRAFLAVVLFLVAAAVVPALPPEGISGRMIVDEVSEGLRQYRREADPARAPPLAEAPGADARPPGRGGLGRGPERPGPGLTSRHPCCASTTCQTSSPRPRGGTTSRPPSGGRRTRPTCAAAPSNSRGSRPNRELLARRLASFEAAGVKVPPGLLTGEQAMSRARLLFVACATLLLALPAAGDRPAPPTRSPAAESGFVGQWAVTFANGVVETCEVRADGTAE